MSTNTKVVAVTDAAVFIDSPGGVAVRFEVGTEMITIVMPLHEAVRLQSALDTTIAAVCNELHFRAAEERGTG